MLFIQTDFDTKHKAAFFKFFKFFVINMKLAADPFDTRQHMILTGSGIVTGDLNIQLQLGGKARSR